jgi:NADPH:quinone reductase-like Zn-dependent oxidoreductase
MSSCRRLLLCSLIVLPPAVVLSASAIYREQHRPHLPPHNLLDLSGKTVVVTGGSSGIGEASVDRLRELGATVICGSRSDGSLDLADIGTTHCQLVCSFVVFKRHKLAKMGQHCKESVDRKSLDNRQVFLPSLPTHLGEE